MLCFALRKSQRAAFIYYESLCLRERQGETLEQKKAVGQHDQGQMLVWPLRKIVR